MAISKREEGKKVNSNINVTPMVDVMLVLLIIFMVITPMLNNKVNVDLPKVSAAIVMENANKEDAIVIAVTRDGQEDRRGRGQDGLYACGQSRQLRQSDGCHRRRAYRGRKPAWPFDGQHDSVICDSAGAQARPASMKEGDSIWEWVEEEQAEQYPRST
jgi:hypothetical protein